MSRVGAFAHLTMRARRPQRFLVNATDRWVLVVLIALPVALYVPYALVGHPVIPGDNLTQNLPFRVLSGDIIRGGQLPTWNPLVWSGTPLLAGWNAGAMFPGTWLFAVLPAVAAWTINLIGVPIIASTGMYLFLRELKVHAAGAFCAAMTFTYTGFLTGQIVHIGLVQGTSLLPWMLIGIEKIFNPAKHAKLPGYVALLALAFGGSILAGDPRAATDSPIVVAIYVAASLVRSKRRSFIPLYASFVALVLGGLLSAIQWLPGIGFLHTSQRGVTAYSFFGSGSIDLGRLTTLLLAPFLLGGNGNFGLPIYAGSYNLPEVTVGCGVVALAAAFSCLPALAAQAKRFLLRRAEAAADPSTTRLGVWFVFIVLGVVLTLGTTTPLGHVLVHIPLYGNERLQNRNGVFVDLGLAVITGYFVDSFTKVRSSLHSADEQDNRTAPRRDRTRQALQTQLSRIFALVPVVALLSLVGYAYANPTGLQQRLQVPNISNDLIAKLTPYLVAAVAVTVLFALFVLFRHRWRRSAQVVALCTIVLADVGIFIANASYATTPAAALAPVTSLSAQVAHLNGPDGRFAIYDPKFYGSGFQLPVPLLAGVSDINILQSNPSVQGYGSIVQGTYQDATQTHDYEQLAISRLSSETFNTLDLKNLLTLPEYIGGTLPTSGSLPLEISKAPIGVGPWRLVAGQPRTWILPGNLALSQAVIALSTPAGPYSNDFRVSFIAGNGRSTLAIAHVIGNELTVPALVGQRFNAIAITADTNSPALPRIETVVVDTTSPTKRLVLNGLLQGAIAPPHWHFSTTVGPYLVYANTETRGLAWLQKKRARTPNTAQVVPGSVHVLTTARASTETMIVSAPDTVTLARSETYGPGWTARITPVRGGPTVVETVRRFGLVQAVSIPAGTYTVTWRYAPGQVFVGFILTILAFLASCVLLAVFLRRRHLEDFAEQGPSG